jgi:hypothetical protein
MIFGFQWYDRVLSAYRYNGNGIFSCQRGFRNARYDHFIQ